MRGRRTGRDRARWLCRAGAACVALLLIAGAAAAGPREQARRLHDRLVGVPPTEAVLAQMAALVATGDPVAAGYVAMQHPAFYRSTLKNFVTPWTNVEQTVFAELNDYTATVIGMVRDEVPFDRVLSDDVVYVGAPGVVAAAYSHTDNEHYRQLEDARIDLSNPALLVPRTQSGLPGSQLSTQDTAGVITTRAAGAAFFSAGTNRRMWRFVSMNYLCRDLEDLKDITRPVDRIRQDVSRSPGGDSAIFHNHCTGCHSGMDPVAGAFAYYNFDETAGRVVFTRGVVQPKFHINSEVFPQGYRTLDDRWDNYWREGINANLGWRAPDGGGFGPKSLGIEVGSSRAFSVCQAEKVLAQVCFRPPNSADDLAEIERIATVFETENRSLKRVFAESAAYCMGE